MALDRAGADYPEDINAPEEAEYFGRKCLIARRLLERGVRFVQIWSGNDNSFPRRNWDSHEDLAREHGPLARGMAKGTSALIKDLKQRGLLGRHRSFCGPPNLAGCRRRREAPVAIITRMCLPTGCVAAASGAGSLTASRTNGDSNHSTGRIRLKSTTCTPRFCICLVSTICG